MSPVGVSMVSFAVFMASDCVAWSQCVWHCPIGCGKASVGVSRPECVLHGFNGCGIPSVEVALPHCILSGCSMFSVSVACPLLSSVGVPYFKWVCLCPQYGLSVAWPLCVWHVRSWCGMASVDVAWPLGMWHGLSGCGMASMGVEWFEWVCL